MANTFKRLNPNQNPIPVETAGGGTPGFLFGIVVANTNALTAALAAVVPQYTLAIVLSTKEIFVTEDNVNWQAYS